VSYNELTRRHFETAVNAGELRGPGTRRGMAGSRAQGTWVQFDVQIDLRCRPATLGAVRFLAYACPHVIAVSDWIAAQAVGGEARAVLPENVASLQQRFAVPVEKLGRLLVVEDAWLVAMGGQT
jgi:NifU-like protein involved in Fe-S cluster formation